MQHCNGLQNLKQEVKGKMFFLTEMLEWTLQCTYPSFSLAFKKQMVIFLILLFKNQVVGIFNGQGPFFKSPLKNDASRRILLFRATLEH